jgi:hypothetical protein
MPDFVAQPWPPSMEKQQQEEDIAMMRSRSSSLIWSTQATRGICQFMHHGVVELIGFPGVQRAHFLGPSHTTPYQSIGMAKRAEFTRPGSAKVSCTCIVQMPPRTVGRMHPIWNTLYLRSAIH